MSTRSAVIIITTAIALSAGCASELPSDQDVGSQSSALGGPYPLHVDVSGLGSIDSNPAGIHCMPDCFELYPEGTGVLLTATAAPGWAFQGWSGPCGGTGPCWIGMFSPVNVHATFTPVMPLTVSVSSGGSVHSVGPGINCPGDCFESYPIGAVVTLQAVPQTGWSFAGWGGGVCGGLGPCSLTMSAPRNVTASFVPASSLVQVTRSGSGTGTVTSSPPGINCGADCAEVYPAGTVVVLTATPQLGSTFAGWSGGGCSGTGTCAPSTATSVTVNAAFTLNLYPLAVNVSGEGTVVSSPAGINCPGDCFESIAHGTPVTLTATPAAGWGFAGWSGSCGGSGPVCSFLMTSPRTTTATFFKL